MNDCSQIRPGLSSLIKVDDVEDVLEEAPEKLADSMILFCQVIISSIYALLIPTQSQLQLHHSLHFIQCSMSYKNQLIYIYSTVYSIIL